MRYFRAIVSGLILTGLLVILLGMYLFRAIERLEDDIWQIANKRQTIVVLEQVFSAVKDAETSQRGFILTGDEAYLEPYNSALLRIDSLLLKLKLHRQLPDQTNEYTILESLTKRRLVLLAEIMNIRRQRGFTEAQLAIASKKGMYVMDSLRAVCNRIESQEEYITIAAVAQHTRNNSTAIFTSLFAVLLLLIGFTVTMVMFLRYRARNEKELRTQQEFTNTILDTVPSFVYLFDVQKGTFDYTNNFFERLTGYSKLELQERGADLLWSLIHPEDIEFLRNRFGEIMQNGKDNTIYESEYRLLHKNGSWCYFTDRAIVFGRDENGAIRHILSFLYDITDRVHAEKERVQSETLLKGVLDTSLYGIVVVDAIRNDKQEIVDFRYTLLNEAARKGFGRPLEEVQISTMSQLFPAVLQTGQFSQYCEVVETGNSAIFDVQYLGDGYNNWFTNVCSKLNDGLVILYYDISDRKAAEAKVIELNAALENTNTDLERLVEERTAQLHRVNQELVFTNQQFQETNKELEAFSYSVSHDLRAPLRSVNGFAEMLRERYKEQLDEEGLRLLGRITNGAQKMGILIDELLALSRLGRKALQISDVNMMELVRSVLEELNSHNELAEYSIEISALPNAVGDTALLRQVWVNLLSNAVKYSRHSASKTISITSFVRNGSPVYAISDQGVGFDMRYADKLFNVFQRLHKERDFEGTGIGLAIVKRIVTKHGGQIWAEAEVNKGATFSFSLLNLSSQNIL
jgi:PAS domain S-box-containing protein